MWDLDLLSEKKQAVKKSKKKKLNIVKIAHNEYLKFTRKISKGRYIDFAKAEHLLLTHKEYLLERYGSEVADYFEQLAREYLHKKRLEQQRLQSIERKRKLKKAVRRTIGKLLWGSGRL
jgi:cell division ATPase FtsA